MSALRLPLVVCLVAFAGTARAEEVVAGKPVEHWLKQLKEGGALARQDAATALGELGERGEKYVPLLRPLLRERKLCRPAALALARIGGKAVPVLVEALADKESQWRRRHRRAWSGWATAVAALKARALSRWMQAVLVCLVAPSRFSIEETETGRALPSAPTIRSASPFRPVGSLLSVPTSP
jgi:HEAT repeats